MATAAVADSKFKDKRRAELDQAIDDAKAELEAEYAAVPMEKQETAHPEINYHKVHRAVDNDGLSAAFADAQRKQALEQPADTEKASEEDSTEAAIDRDLLETLLKKGTENVTRSEGRERLLLLDYLSNFLRENTRHSEARLKRERTFAPQSVEGQVADRGVATIKQPLDVKKLVTQECSVAKLVLRMLVYSSATKRHGEQIPEGFRELPTESHADLSSRIRRMQKQLLFLECHPDALEMAGFHSPELPSYLGHGPMPNVDEQAGLKKVLLTILNKHARKKTTLQVMIGKLCYNLLSSNSPPSVDTYNILIIYLSRFKENALTNFVIDSLLESHIRMNETTVSAILKFYTACGNKHGFLKFVARLDGVDQSGLSLARPSIYISGDNERLIHRRDDRILQRPPMNQIVFGAIINGTLKFVGIEAAIEWYNRMIREGYDANVEILTSLLKYSYQKRDWMIGQTVWEQIQGLFAHNGDRPSSLELNPRAFDGQSRFNMLAISRALPQQSNVDDRAYHWMLQLCRVCKKHREFEWILREALNRGLTEERVLHSPTKTKSLRFDKPTKPRLATHQPKDPIQLLEQALEDSEYFIARMVLKIRKILTEKPKLRGPSIYGREKPLRISRGVQRDHIWEQTSYYEQVRYRQGKSEDILHLSERQALSPIKPNAHASKKLSSLPDDPHDRALEEFDQGKHYARYGLRPRADFRHGLEAPADTVTHAVAVAG
ncbi:MAG: hypothetical protein M1819_004479 [Sarea resinae]|nr:MAG: hypothetical protein M1819_004479 [Sarea resinae]